MLTDDLIKQLEPSLREKIRVHYGKKCCFEPGYGGASILQAARIACFRLMQTYGENLEMFLNDPSNNEEFFETVEEELKSGGIDRSFSPGSYTKEGKGLLNRLIPQRQTFAETVNSFPNLTIDDIVEHLKKPQSKEKREALDALYKRRVIEIYEDLARDTGRPNWRAFSHQHPGFFDWQLNRRIAVYHFTTNYVLPHFDCTLENLPLQKGLRVYIHNNGPVGIYSRVGYSKRGFFLEGFPHMIDSPHWHPSRWYHPRSVSGLKPQELEEWRRFRLDYLFRYVLGCRTKDDVIFVLNDRGELETALKKEEISGRRKYWIIDSKHPYSLVKDLPGPMYQIDPWELNAAIPPETWSGSSGLKEETIIRYLGWVSKRADLSMMTARDVMSCKIPHLWPLLNDFFGGRINELKEFYQSQR